MKIPTEQRNLFIEPGVMETWEIAYSAGVLDGEGSIQINPSLKKPSGKCYWSLTVQISTCCQDLAIWLQKRWNIGSVTVWSPKNGKQTSYNWRLYSQESERFLRAVLPYLLVKREVAELAIEFRSHVADNHGKGMPRERLGGDVSRERTRIAEAVQALNRRYGKSKLRGANRVAR